jgi:hypothetical protein
MGADHGAEKGPGSICYHYPTGEYVQTSSTIIAVGSDIAESKIHTTARATPARTITERSTFLVKKILFIPYEI